MREGTSCEHLWAFSQSCLAQELPHQPYAPVSLEFERHRHPIGALEAHFAVKDHLETHVPSDQVGREDRDSGPRDRGSRSEEHTSELQSLMRNSYAVFCLKKNKTTIL